MVRKAAICLFVVSLLLLGGRIFAVDCLTITTNSSSADKNFCKKELTQIEAELAELLKKQDAQRKNSGTLQGDISYLTSQINALKAKIKARSFAIAQIKVSIGEKNSTIRTLEEKIRSQQESIAQLLRNTNEFDQESIIHLILSDASISDFYSDVESYSSIKKAVKNAVDELRGVKTTTEVEKKGLEEKQNAETDARAELEGAQRKVARSETEKKQLLVVSKQKESEYQKLAAEKRARAARIRAALFPLANTTQKIEFGTALAYAYEVKGAFGVDPAFLLAILTQESNLGANVGQCLLTNTATGAGVGKNTGTPFINLMKPTRDVGPFLEITKKLGLDPFQTPVSCPIAGVAGWGGAMGAAQFIPSTWKLFESRLQGLLGRYPSPWVPRDAFFASGMYLSDLGAIGTSQSAQNIAACRYYGAGGTSCSYGASVARIKAGIQANIDLLE
ncbi:MAG: lytic murein transglycosylase [Patescibacteria group bacterium]